MAQIPRGHENLFCPFWQKPMDQVCHKCPMWVQIRGTDPNTGETIADEWQCSITWLPKLLIENSQQSRQAGASADKVATEVRKLTNTVVDLNNRGLPPTEEPPQIGRINQSGVPRKVKQPGHPLTTINRS